MKTKNLFIIAVVVIAILGIAYIFSLQLHRSKLLPYYTYDQKTKQLTSSTLPGNRITSFRFTNQLGETISEVDLEEQIWVADYFFTTCPGICKAMSSQLQRVYASFEEEPSVRILSHTSKPEEDSTAVLLSYAQKYKVKDHRKWMFLTGSQKDLYHVARNQYHIVNDEPNPDSTEDFIHTERFVLVDKEHFIRGYYDGTDSVEVSRLINDIHSLLQE